ncbi:lipopolysaccharide assembly protein LapB [Caulobacter segnis]|uniref:Endoglucanase n=1 Tax=Caulobacter segnis TaxID=88688 RepID=A0A2W5VES7_9CAUL|nr:endoglucanase [Caulobacter segnis]PZR36343.1 MAG: endoglucanase [Caulobacter segnis]
MTLRQFLRSSVAAACIAGVLAPSGYAAPPPVAARSALDVRVAQAADFSRVEFHWNGGARMAARRDGQALILRFSRDADPDLSVFRISPPRWVKGVEARHVGGALELVLTIAEEADFKAGAADGVSFVNIFAKDGALAAAQASTPSAPPPPVGRPNPMPRDGVVRADIERSDGQVTLSFTWAAPAGAAVFRRGEAVWIVFDTPARIDISKLPANTPRYSRLQALKGADYSALRIVAPVGEPYVAVGSGPTWRISFGPGPQQSPDIIQINRDEAAPAAALSAAVAGVTRALWVEDPAVGDKIIVAPALAPAKGLSSRRDYVEFALLQSAQGLAAEAYASDLMVQASVDQVRIGRPKGLALSPASAAAPPEEAVAGAPEPLSMPALIDLEAWPKLGSGGFLARYNALQSAISAAPDEDADVAARLALARFLVGSQMSFEAIGVLNAGARKHQTMMANPEFRGLRGMARALAGRYAEAEADFSSPVLADEPSSALWRGYIATRNGQWLDARTKFASGGRALELFPPIWKARFLGAQAEAALGVGDLTGAFQYIAKALDQPKIPVQDQLAIRLIQARAFEAKGEKVRAKKMFQAIARAPYDKLAAPALLHATELQYEKREINAAKAADTLNQLRYRWRGDGVEMEVIRALGKLYIDQGRYREALEVMRSAGRGTSDRPEALSLRNEISNTFRALFLDGLADGMQPIQAVGLFYDFQELTPIGADGDQMVRNLVRRLVDVDLLDDAAKLLKYQVDNRLNGVPKAQVATDLAWIYLMNKRPEDALNTINATRTTILPPALNAERRLATARALIGLGRYDAAGEMVERDNSKDGQEIRADIAWKQRAWPTAGALYERMLGDRWKGQGALSAADEARLLRSAVAYSLADDDAALGRLRQRWTRFVDNAGNPDGLRVALQGLGSEAVSPTDFGKVSADNEAFSGWVARMKDKFRTGQPAGAPARAGG